LRVGQEFEHRSEGRPARRRRRAKTARGILAALRRIAENNWSSRKVIAALVPASTKLASKLLRASAYASAAPSWGKAAKGGQEVGVHVAAEVGRIIGVDGGDGCRRRAAPAARWLSISP
jgi:hypothetical protein